MTHVVCVLLCRCHSYDDYDNAGYTKGTDDYYTKIGFSLQDERDEKVAWYWLFWHV